MQIVIEMPEDEFEAICRQVTSGHEFSYGYIAIANGTPLPKEHGDLIDRSEVIKSLFDYHNGKKTIGQCIDDVQTIIEADKAESEE